MATVQKSSWDLFQNTMYSDDASEFHLDLSRMAYATQFGSVIENWGGKFERALAAMKELESGAIANPDENRMVGHYWLRDPERAPSKEISQAISAVVASITSFAADVHSGKILTSKGETFKHVLVVGIGGSALGPQFVNDALSRKGQPLDIYFFDNTDPDGMEKVLASIPELSRTLVIVTSKSGGTKETRNGQLIAAAALEKAGVKWNQAFLAVTLENSDLDNLAVKEQWLGRFHLWDWVGGRTSQFSAVGLLPAALEGFNIEELLAGARYMDSLTRASDLRKNPAGLLALSWFKAGQGKGLKDMVVLPYRDRLLLLSKYLQQLLMESLGKEKDLDGKVVNQGIAVYGNKGSTDQHAYVQQLRDGINNFFAVFIEVLRDEVAFAPHSVGCAKFQVEPGVTAGDYLSGFYLGTREALSENHRENLTITVREVSEKTIGMLVALFERAVGFYAHFINVNAYHQPGVEAGKKAATRVLELQKKVEKELSQSSLTIAEIAQKIGETEQTEIIFKIVSRMAANDQVRVQRGNTLSLNRYERKN